jgi:hypothetical protein
MNLRSALGLLLLAVSPVLADPATVLRPADLKREPFSDAATVARLEPGQQVEATARRGGWLHVRAGSAEGWSRMTALRLGDDSGGGGDSGLGSVVRFVTTGRSGSSGVTAATGIRGLDAADVIDARPDHEAVQQVERFAVQPEQAERFAGDGGLVRASLDYLPEAGDATDEPLPGVLGGEW